MAAAGEGPIIASDVTKADDRHDSRLQLPDRDPNLSETLHRLIALQSADTAIAARRYAQLVILPERNGVGRLEFHKLDHMRGQGRRAAAHALETAPPEVFGAPAHHQSKGDRSDVCLPIKDRAAGSR
jgi:predicted acylesterase/phospholipase RssA